MSLSPRLLWFLFLACAALAAALFGSHQLAKRVKAPAALLTADCDVNQGPCRVTLGEGRTGEFVITPRPVAVMQPLALTWQDPALPASARVSIEFDGTDMSMGFNRVNLQADAAGVFRGSAILPVCATGAMRWQAVLRVDGQGPGVRFLFSTPGQQ